MILKEVIITLKKYIISILLFVIFAIFILSYFKIHKVNVKGGTHYTEEQVIDLVITNPFYENSLFLMFKDKVFGMDSIPFIQTIKIERVSSHEVTIIVYEKPPIGCIKYMNNYVYFDKDGIVLESSSEKLEDVPYIKGVNFSGFTLYKKLQVESNDIFHVILNLSQIIEKYGIDIDKIIFNQKEEVTLTSGDVTIYLGKRKLYDEQLINLSRVLPKAKEIGYQGKIDMKNYQAGKDIIFKQSNPN